MKFDSNVVQKSCLVLDKYWSYLEKKISYILVLKIVDGCLVQQKGKLLAMWYVMQVVVTLGQAQQSHNNDGINFSKRNKKV